ncbi:MAG: SHD1 domain-containing protein [Planctomycetota bacterium]
MRTHVLRNGSLPCPSRVLVIPKAMLCCLIFGLPFLAGQVSDCAIAKSPVGEMRTWKDQTGAFQVEATLLDVHNGRITLRKKDGRLVRPPISLLSDADQEFVSKWEEAREAGNIFAGGVMPKPTEEDGDDDTGPVAASGKRLPSWRPGTEPVEVQSGRILVLQSMGRPALKDPDPAAVVHSKKDAGTLSLTAMKGSQGRPL